MLYVIREKWHVDIGFAAADLMVPLTALSANFIGARYLIVSFGDRHYLVAKDKEFSGMLEALWPGPGVIMAYGLTTSPSDAFGVPQVISIAVTLAQERAAQAFVWESLSKQGTSIESYAAGPFEGSLYFEATHSYSALYTCNTWAAEVLQAAGLPIRRAGVVFAGQLWSQVLQWARTTREPYGIAPGPQVARPMPAAITEVGGRG